MPKSLFVISQLSNISFSLTPLNSFGRSNCNDCPTALWSEHILGQVCGHFELLLIIRRSISWLSTPPFFSRVLLIRTTSKTSTTVSDLYGTAGVLDLLISCRSFSHLGNCANANCASFSFPAYPLVDRKGRRWLLLWTFPFMGELHEI